MNPFSSVLRVSSQFNSLSPLKDILITEIRLSMAYIVLAVPCLKSTFNILRSLISRVVTKSRVSDGVLKVYFTPSLFISHLIQKPLTRIKLKLNLVRFQLSLDIALASEVQHLIAGKLFFGQ